MKNKIFILAVATSLVACNIDNSSPELITQIDSVSYSLGVSVASNLKASGFENLESGKFSNAFDDVFSALDLKISEEDANVLINEYFVQLSQKKSDEVLEKGTTFLQENSTKEGVITTESGLQYIVINQGQGDSPGLNDNVTVHYNGTLIDGTVFDSSIERGEPATFGVGQVIPGWTEALQLMSVGSKFKLFIPSDLAYGSKGAGGAIGPNETLIFDVELLSIN